MGAGGRQQGGLAWNGRSAVPPPGSLNPTPPLTPKPRCLTEGNGGRVRMSRLQFAALLLLAMSLFALLFWMLLTLGSAG